MRVLLFWVTGAVCAGEDIVADGVVPLPAAVPVVPVVPIVPVLPDVDEVPVVPCCVGAPSLRRLLLGVTGAVVDGLVVVADGVVPVVCAWTRPIEPSRAAAAAAVLRRLKAFMYDSWMVEVAKPSTGLTRTLQREDSAYACEKVEVIRRGSGRL